MVFVGKLSAIEYSQDPGVEVAWYAWAGGCHSSSI